MSDVHEHVWTPVSGECATYACPCGATGSRRQSGKIIAHSAARRFVRQTVELVRRGCGPDFEIEGDAKEPA